jgi:hypothetical protein
VIAGGSLALAKRASYTLGPTWSSVQLNVGALDLWNGGLFVDWRPIRELRLGYDLHRQHAGVYPGFSVRTSTSGARTFGPAIEDPNFTDNRVRASWRAFDVGWLRADARFRVRPDRKEWRWGGALDLDHLGLGGLFVRGHLARAVVSFDQEMGKPNLARTLWSAAGGYRVLGFDGEAGASFIDRAAGPISSRVSERPGPTAPINLAPFVLEAQRILYARLFYAGDLWFAGLDAEQNLENQKEQRFFAQLGVLVEEAW